MVQTKAALVRRFMYSQSCIDKICSDVFMVPADVFRGPLAQEKTPSWSGGSSQINEGSEGEPSCCQNKSWESFRLR